MSDQDDQDPPVVLDEHRGIAAQKATDERQHSSEVVADQESLRQRQAELEKFMFAASAASWPEAAEHAIYLLRRFASTPEGQDPRYKKMIADTLDDFRRLVG